jgi:hypothetical protein
MNEPIPAEKSRGAITPIATPEQAIEAYKVHGSDRKAAMALGISRTQVRRLRGVEK